MNKNEIQGLTTVDKLSSAIVQAVESGKSNLKFIDCPLVHRFTPGLYSRHITMPKGSLVVSEIHKTRHQFVLLDGVVDVWTEKTGWVLMKSPVVAITEPGTQRVLKCHTKVEWVTFHENKDDKWKTAEDVYKDIIEVKDNPLLEGRYKNNEFIPQNKTIET